MSTFLAENIMAVVPHSLSITDSALYLCWGENTMMASEGKRNDITTVQPKSQDTPANFNL